VFKCIKWQTKPSDTQAGAEIGYRPEGIVLRWGGGGRTARDEYLRAGRDDLALALAAKRIRILAPVPGKGAVGIEVPNPEPETVYLGEILSKAEGQTLPIAMGKRLEGEPFAADICSMPHLLIAGATGSGKSVCIHSIITTILMTRTPREVRLAMVDPKMLELSVYEGIPHLWAPVVLETSKARILLEALVAAVSIQLLLTFLRKSEEEFLDNCDEYCHRHIVNRLRMTPYEQAVE